MKTVTEKLKKDAKKPKAVKKGKGKGKKKSNRIILSSDQTSKLTGVQLRAKIEKAYKADKKFSISRFMEKNGVYYSRVWGILKTIKEDQKKNKDAKK